MWGIHDNIENTPNKKEILLDNIFMISIPFDHMLVRVNFSSEYKFSVMIKTNSIL